jgi:hypothetical protein
MFTRKEGKLTRALERQTARIPSGTFLGIAGGSILASLSALLIGKKGIANFIGQWVPTVLLLGMYNKFVKEAT